MEATMRSTKTRSAVAGSRPTSGNERARTPIRKLLTAPENTVSSARGATSTRSPWTATIARAAKRLPSTLENKNAIAVVTSAPVFMAPIMVSAARGRRERCVPATNSPPKSSNDTSLDPKMVKRDSGSAMRMRKSVRSGNSDSPTRPRAAATIHIGTAMRKAWSATTARS